MNIIILGPQGSGKTTQAKLLAQNLGVMSVSAGVVSRQIASENTAEGRLVKSYIDKGELTPDDILFKRIGQIFSSPEAIKGLVLDGFPRNKEQLAQIENHFQKHGGQIDKVIYINLSEDEGVKRIMGRVKSEGRADDTPEAIARRLQIYHEKTLPIIDYYRQHGKLIEIDGSGTIEEVHNLIISKIQ